MTRRPDPMDDDPPTAAVNPLFWLCVAGGWAVVFALAALLSGAFA